MTVRIMALALTIPCTKCGAKIGEQCSPAPRTSSRRVTPKRRRQHLVRIRDANVASGSTVTA